MINKKCYSLKKKTARSYLLKTYGKDILKELEQERLKVKKWQVWELEKLIKFWKAEIKKLAK